MVIVNVVDSKVGAICYLAQPAGYLRKLSLDNLIVINN